MMHMRLVKASLVLFIFISTVLSPSITRAEKCAKWAAKAVSVQGTVEVKSAGDAQWLPVKLNDTFCPGDVVRVQKRSRADLALVNQPVLHLDQNTVMTVGGMKDERTSVVEMAKGAAHFFSRVTRGLEVKTTFVNAGVEGTEFFVRVDDDKVVLSIFEGKVLASNSAGSLAITGGQSAIAEAGKAPVPHVIVRPRDAVQWALYYPPVISYRPDDFQSGAPADWQSLVRQSIGSYWKGDLPAAFSAIEGVPGDVSDAHFILYRASLLLTVGRVDEAGSDIEKALTLDPNSSNAFALQAIVAVTRNEKDKALALARKAVEAGPQSASARVALSYAQQAGFDLTGALSSVKEAVKLEPGNALAWARLAELEMSFGKLDEALKAAEKAVALNPGLSRTQTVLGFAFLTRVKTEEAKAAFEKAIVFDNADPLPRLGLGLAKIREGNLDEGGREIEIAASLDPDNSLIRSYLGKTYFEEKRDKQSRDELDMAKQLDPKDPTPYFYGAIQKQTANQPVEALDDLQQAVELNDNRAVYRSRLLMDADLAARSAGLARIYGDLGFQQRALVEGWNAMSADPADFSSHRFLADSYAALPRQEISRVSELLQAQLLQPINITPIQPHLAESNQFVPGGAGPSGLSFNEFNPLFNRNGFALQVNGIAGENSTSGEEVVASGIYKNASFSAGQYHNETEGFRENNDVKDDISNAFVQISLSPKTSIQAEYRTRRTEKGDTSLGFFTDDFVSSRRQEDRTESTRFGFHHTFSPGSDLIGNFMYSKTNRSVHEVPDPVIMPTLDLKGKDTAYSAELQHLFNSHYVKIIIGAGHFEIDSKDVISYELAGCALDPSLPCDVLIPFENAPFPRDVRHNNIYLYSYINVLKNVMFNVGASADFYKRKLPNDEFTSINNVNPKFGMTWNPVPDTTVRAAAFRTMKRTLITDQTLEPTQVAGFNQFSDEENGTDSTRYGIAVDQKFSKKLFGGTEYTTRELKVPFVDATIDPPVLTAVNWHDRTGRAYVYWAAADWVALNMEYSYEQLQRDEALAMGAKDVETNRVPIGVNFYHSSGWSAALKATHTVQKGHFNRQLNVNQFDPGSDQFWVIDAAINYRIPSRLGSITVGAKNLLNQEFEYFDSDQNNPSIQPKRFLYARATMAF